jgi:rhodanese-related sulfurtransferase
MGIDEHLARARARLQRLTPNEAWAEVAGGGAVIVDTRSADERRAQGVVPGAVAIPRNVLEWRADQTAGSADAALAGRRLIVMCAEGYSSSLAAVSLHEVGLGDATDVIGGFLAWRAAGLPVEPYAR